MAEIMMEFRSLEVHTYINNWPLQAFSQDYGLASHSLEVPAEYEKVLKLTSPQRSNTFQKGIIVEGYTEWVQYIGTSHGES